MMKHKLSMALMIALTGLTGCVDGGGDDVTFNIDDSTTVNNPPASSSGGSSSGGSSSGGATPPPTPPADCSDADATPAFVSLNANCEATVTGRIDQDYTFVKSVQWRLDGPVVVGAGNVNITSQEQVDQIKADGVTLTIEAGTDVRAFDDGTLYVTRGSKLIADGTEAEPITFSSLDSDFDGLGEWGGVIIAGFAPQFGPGGTGACFLDGETWCNVSGEGGAEVDSIFGGNFPDDDSGIINWVRIAEGGRVAGPNNEINGLTLQGVGHGTELSFVQVHNNLDDGVEWFGGTVDATYLLLTGNDDDDIDFDEGSKINVQYALVQKSNNPSPQGSNDPRAIEANSSDDEYVPETDAVLANITLLGGDVNNTESGAQPGMRLRGALTVQVHNTAVSNFDTGCIRIDDAALQDGSTVNSSVTLNNVLNDCRDGIYDKRDADTATNVTAETLTYSPTLAVQESGAQLDAPATINAVNNGSGFVFDQTDFVGAVDPSASSAWWESLAVEGSVRTELEAFEPAPFVSFDEATNTATLTGTIDADYTMVSGVNWVLDGPVRVGRGNVTIGSAAEKQDIIDQGVTLTIRPGVSVKATDDGSLYVTRGSKLEAVGSPAAPIVFSSLDDGFDGLGEWGGVIIAGFAEQFGAGGTGSCAITGETWCNVQGEGGAEIESIFGGTDDDDDSGNIRYFIIAEGGRIAGPNNEVNGLTLQGVGYNTSVDFVQVHNNLDDGVEWFGGTVSATHLVLTGNDDDDIDFDEGWRGNIQFAIVQKSNNASPQGSNDPRGIEANSSDDEYVPETNAVLSNVHVEGGTVSESQPGMRLRGALTVQVHNSVVAWTGAEGCIRIDDAALPDGTTVNSNVILQDTIGACEAGFYDKRDADAVAGVVGEDLNITITPAYGIGNAPAPSGTVPLESVSSEDGFVFDQSGRAYIGANPPEATTGWQDGWIIEGSLREK